VRHGFFAVDVFTGRYRVHGEPACANDLVRRHNAIDVFIGQELLIASSYWEVRFRRNLPRQGVTPIAKVKGRDALHAGQFDGIAQQVRSLHADADHPETEPLARRN
jgi:aconitase A